MSDSHPPYPTDEELVTRVQHGDQEIFGELMDRYTEKLSRYGRQFLARPEHIEDLVQDVFIKAYQNIQSVDTSRKFSSWIYRIAHNAFVNALRAQQTAPISYFDFDTFTAHPVYEDGHAERKEAEEMRVLVEKGIKKLDQKYREVVMLYYFENMDYQQIADILHVPIGTVGIRLSRAKALLKKELPVDTTHI